MEPEAAAWGHLHLTGGREAEATLQRRQRLAEMKDGWRKDITVRVLRAQCLLLYSAWRVPLLLASLGVLSGRDCILQGKMARINFAATPGCPT